MFNIPSFYGFRSGGFTGLLDEYSGAAAAYSLRLLRAGYTGDAIRVRRSTDNAETDIGFDSNGELDTTALLAHVGTGGTDNGFVETWYDQSGNGYDATQTSLANQPQIVSGGSVLTLTGSGSANPCIRFDGNNDLLDLSSSIPISTGDKFSIFQVEKKTNPSSIGIWITGGPTSSRSPFGPVHYSSAALFMNTKFNATTTSGFRSGSLSGNNYNLISGYMKDSDTNSNAYVNNVLFSFSTTSSENRGTSFSRIGARRTENSNTSTQEMIIYLSDQSSNNTAINTNINDFYSIY